MFTEARGESRNLSVGHGRKMAPHQLGALRQQLVEMAAPARRVGFVAGDEAARLGRIQNLLDAPSEARGGFRGPRPQGLENRKHGFRVDRVNGHATPHLMRQRQLLIVTDALCGYREFVRNIYRFWCQKRANNKPMGLLKH